MVALNQALNRMILHVYVLSLFESLSETSDGGIYIVVCKYTWINILTIAAQYYANDRYND